MKILHVTQGYAPAIGGTEWLIQRVSEELARQFGDEVTVFTTNRWNGQGFVRPFAPRMATGWEERNSVRVRRFPVVSLFGPVLKVAQALAYRGRLPMHETLRALYSGPIIPGLEGEIARQPADVIAAASFPLLHMFAAQRAARRSRRPCVLIGCLHPEDAWGFGRDAIRAAVLQADVYVALTEYEAAYVRGLGLEAERVWVAGGGVDPEPFRLQAAQAKRQLGIDPSVPVVGYIGQMVSHKGVDLLLRAMPRVWAAFPETRLLLAGSRTTYQRQLEAVIDSLPAEQRKNVIWRTNFAAEEKPQLFNALDIFVYPSMYESFGIAFLEAWAAGKPVIGLRRGAVPAVVSHEQDGLLLRERSEEELAGAVEALLRDPALAQALGAAGERKVLERYTWTIVARLFRRAYAFAAAHPRQNA